VGRDIRFKIWPKVTKQDEKFVLASLHQDSHSWGPNAVALQDEFAQWNGNRFCAATNSGTAALHMGLTACGVGAGDEVITTTLSWTSSATCILHHNAIPVFVDIDEKTQLIDPARIEAAVTKKTRAIIPVHYWGLPCDMNPIMTIARRHKLFVIEDCCQAHGATYKGRRVGTIGHCGAFSLNQNKNFSAGDGGLFVTENEDRYVKARALMSFGEMRAPEADRDFHSYGMGWMYRIGDLGAAYARSALRRLDTTNAQARANWDRLQEGLKDVPGMILPYDSRKQSSNGYAFVIRVAPESIGRKGKTSVLRDAVVDALKAEGVPVAPARMSLPAHTVFQARNGYGQGCPWTCRYARKGIRYDMKQYPITNRVTESSIQIAINGHRPPNGSREIKAIIAGLKKVFENLDQVPVKT
jgi:dTDP-4-amino-4,6-dideoxygalactose transaminase